LEKGNGTPENGGLSLFVHTNLKNDKGLQDKEGKEGQSRPMMKDCSPCKKKAKKLTKGKAGMGVKYKT